MTVKAVGFDFFGTLAEAKADRLECLLSICKHLRTFGYDFSDDDFISNYQAVTAEFRRIRQTDLREVNNRVWITNSLRRMNYDVDPGDAIIGSAVDEYFKPWEITLMPEATRLLERMKGRYKISLISNFTHSPFLNRTLSNLNIARFFDYVIDSDTVGWRKPHRNIFERFIDLSGIKAEEAVFVGDDLEADVKGAKKVGIRTAYLLKPDRETQQIKLIQPDWVIGSLTELEKLLAHYDGIKKRERAPISS